MKYGSVCSGIEAATAAWHGLGWQPSFFSEIEPFPRAVLTHHYPNVPLHGDFTTIKGDQYEPIQLLVGGTPCQSFSVAGLRKGMADERGNLALEYLRLADRLRPRWLVWENVPGVLSSNGGRDFGSILGGMVELGYGIAYRVLDAQYFGVAQRRRRVFVVGYLGDWRRAAAVLFERHSLQGHPPPRREAGQKPAPTISARPTGGRGLGTDFDLDGGLVARCVTTGEGKRQDYETTTIVPVAFTTEQTPKFKNDCAFTLTKQSPTGGGQPQAVAFDIYNQKANMDIFQTLATNPNGAPHNMRRAQAVRRLTPRECERLQGFPDDYTAIPWRGKPAAECPDGPRYKALGNSMAAPVMRWIGQRIAKQETP